MKKLFYLMAITLVLGLFVSGCIIPVVPTSEKGNLNPELGTPTLEKITFIHYVKPAASSKQVWDVEVDKYKLLLGGLKWTEPMKYKVNPTGYVLNEEDVFKDVLEAICQSLETWNEAIDLVEGDPPFVLFETPARNDDVSYDYYAEDRDHVNTVTWGELPYERAIAMCAFWFYPNTKEIVESDVVFSTSFEWSLSGESGKMDLQNIATHEFGHNGLNDLYMPKSVELTMYGYGDYGETKKRDLGTGDKLGIQELYGSD